MKKKKKKLKNHNVIQMQQDVGNWHVYTMHC